MTDDKPETVKTEATARKAGSPPVWIFVVVIAILIGGAYFLSQNTATQSEERDAPEITSLEDDARVQPVMTEGNPVVAVVDGAEIMRDEVLAFVETLPEHIKSMPIENLFPMALDQVVTDKALEQRVASAGLENDPEVLESLEEMKKELTRNVYLQRALDSVVTDAKLQEKYQEIVAQFEDKKETKARHILLETEEAANAVIAKLDEGADFAELAKEESTGPTAERGGDLGYFEKEAMVPEFGDAAFSLKPGLYTKEPVQTQFGWHVIKVEDRRTVEAPTFEEVKPQLEQKLRQNELFVLIQQWKDEADIETYDINGGALEITFIPDEETGEEADEAAEDTAAPETDTQ